MKNSTLFRRPLICHLVITIMHIHIVVMVVVEVIVLVDVMARHAEIMVLHVLMVVVEVIVLVVAKEPLLVVGNWLKGRVYTIYRIICTTNFICYDYA